MAYHNERGEYMVFSSLEFVLIFMPIFFLCYYLAPKRIKNIILLSGSLVFYFIGTVKHPYHFALFILSIVIDYFTAVAMESRPRYKRLLLIFGIMFHLAFLCFFKYAGFAASELSGLFGGAAALDIILPIGISFYTFQSISYIADVYLGRTEAEKSLLRYAVYISMFPQLIAGPIVKYGDISGELRSRTVSRDDALRGLGEFIFGLGLKVLLANPLGKLWTQANTIGYESLSTPLAWMAVAAFSFQLYFDFFGYSVMAVGLGHMLGFSLPKNFDNPYMSLTLTDFWRRWHITLGSWFREYVYIPLGGNRHGAAITVRNLLVVWLLTGMWHGAGYNFLLWGVMTALIILLEKRFYGSRLSAHPLLGHLYMFLLIPLMWSVFAVGDIGDLGMLLSRMFPFFGRGAFSIFRYDYLKYLGQYYPFFIAGVLLSADLPYRLMRRLKNRFVLGAVLALILLACLWCMYRGFDDPFLYFRF